MNKLTSVFVIILLCFACEPPKREKQEGQEILQEIRDRKIKRVTDAELLAAAGEKGAEIGNKLAELSRPLISDGALTGCDKIVPPDLSALYPFVSSCRLVCDSAGLTLPKEKMIWEAYRYNESNKMDFAGNLQKTETGDLLWTEPISEAGKYLGMWSVLISKKQLIRQL